MAGIWAEAGDGGFEQVSPVGFTAERELHDLIERSPAMLPLAGAPRLVMLGREVQCGSGYADLVAVEVDAARPVVIEVKLASNADRRQVLTQVLGYAAWLRRLDGPAFEARLGGSVAARVAEAAPDTDLDRAAFAADLDRSLRDGRLRCVIVIDEAKPDLVELVGYLQEISNERLNLDLITVSAYDIGGRNVLVPQLVEPDRSQVTADAAGSTPRGQYAVPAKGSESFAAAIARAPTQAQPVLRRLLEWARQLEQDGLAVLYTTEGKGRWVLNPRLPGREHGMITIWNINGAQISPAATVLEREAPEATAALIRHAGQPLVPNGYLPEPYDVQLLTLLRQAYEEAATHR